MEQIYYQIQYCNVYHAIVESDEPRVGWVFLEICLLHLAGTILGLEFRILLCFGFPRKTTILKIRAI